MNFGEAIEALKNGRLVARAGWNGRGMHLYLDHGCSQGGSPTTPQRTFDPHVVLFTVQGTYQPGWTASQADMLATDWETV